MIAVMQTKRGGNDVPPEERGDCMPACFASILEVGIGDVAVPHAGDRHWWDEAQDAVGRHGHTLVVFDLGCGFPDAFWIAVVPSLNLKKADGSPLPHNIVMHGSDVRHDPSLGKRYETGPLPDDVEPLEGWVLVPRSHGHAK